MSVFFIKTCLVAVGTEQDVRHPVRRSAHLLTDHIQVNIGTAFDDQLIMNVTDNEAVPECLHGIAEDVAADSLDDVLHELWTVGADEISTGMAPRERRGGHACKIAKWKTGGMKPSGHLIFRLTNIRFGCII